MFLDIERFVQIFHYQRHEISPDGSKFMFSEEDTEGCYQKRPQSNVHQAQNQATVHTLTVGILLSFDG